MKKKKTKPWVETCSLEEFKKVMEPAMNEFFSSTKGRRLTMKVLRRIHERVRIKLAGDRK